MTNSITPTIGRKVWFWASEHFIQETGCEPLDSSQPYDATIVFVYPNGRVNLHIVDHEGETGLVENCQLRDPDEGSDEHGEDEDFATWMPYQVGQAKKQFDDAKKEESS